MANSAFSLVMVTAFLPVYFRKAIAEGVEPGRADAYWGYAISGAMAVVALSSPVMGALADRWSWRKRLLIAYTLIGVVATASWSLVSPGDVLAGLLLFALANVMFEGSLVFYDSLLPGLVAPERLGRWSGYGWSMGYVGSLGCLAVALFLVQTGRAAWVFPLVAIWWLLWSLPLMFAVRERGEPLRDDGPGVWEQLARTIGRIRRNPDLARFFVAFFFYNDGIATTIAFAGLYATGTLGFSAEETIVLIGVVQVAGAVGAFSLGFVADKVGHARTIMGTLCAWIGLMLCAYFVTTKGAFWGVALGVGLVMGATQSASRGFLASVASTDAGELFGFKAVAGKFSAVMGPLLFGVISEATGDQRLALLAVGSFFVVGLVLMARVDERRAAGQGVQ
ncbi:MAG: MFS transporter [Myxococcota bacterium]|nr:MFS transporter [Myxococcota bacterium]